MSGKMIRMGISQGNPNAIASELVLKAFNNVEMYGMGIPVLYGSSKILGYYRKMLDIPSVNVSNLYDLDEPNANRLNVVNVIPEEFVVEVGQLSDESIRVADESLRRACDDLSNGRVDVLVTLPATSKDAATVLFPEQKGEALKIFVNDTLRIAVATDSATLSGVAPSITAEKLTERIKALQSSLIHDFIITSPRIAVLALNPQPGQEEETIIRPAIQAASDSGVFCFGPYTAEEFFSTDVPKKFDAILAMYHDQGMIAFQSMAAGQGVVFTANFPFVITAPVQGLSCEKAGKNICEPDAFRQAIYLAADLFQNRNTDREIHRNPLKRQFFDRGLDNEKLDLTKD
ncbi:4-hydroxythreonine-4-phosphate dehydrogenase [Candidatus Symbiothrix dinenymphae]|nr:4-hydroxythreonine-4-phosphate dehydrogenase [Candidatus Symbiothrix dinenymphae]